MVKVRFWGTRGSIPTPGHTTIKYGGNTSCVEVRTGDDTLIVLDAGSGIRELGRAIFASGVKPVVGHVLISHTHWDHIQGFPFFGPAFVPGNRFTVYGAPQLDKTLEQALAGQMEHSYFPVRLDQMGGTINIKEIKDGKVQMGSAQVSCHYLNHPSVCIGYRVEADGATIVYATDTEPKAESLDEETDRSFVDFATGADLLIHDAMYSLEEFRKKRGWGHSHLDYVVDVAKATGAKRLALFHHDPEHSDEVIQAFEEHCKKRAALNAPGLEVFSAAEGMEILL